MFLIDAFRHTLCLSNVEDISQVYCRIPKAVYSGTVIFRIYRGCFRGAAIFGCLKCVARMSRADIERLVDKWCVK